jgi:hypothetical protein
VLAKQIQYDVSSFKVCDSGLVPWCKDLFHCLEQKYLPSFKCWIHLHRLLIKNKGEGLPAHWGPSDTGSTYSWAVIAQSVQRWATGWMIGVLGFDSQRGLGIFLFTTASRTALGPTQPPIQCIPGALSLGIKRPGREADHSPPFSVEVKEWVELYLHPPVRLHGVVLS